MKAKSLFFMAALLWNGTLFASTDKVTKELTLLNVGAKIQKALKRYYGACNALVDENGNKVINQVIVNEPKPITIARPKRAIENEIKPLVPARPKRAVENEIKPLVPARPKTLEVIDCHRFRRELAFQMVEDVESILEKSGANINEYSEVVDFVENLRSNMEAERDTSALDAYLNSKRLYRGLELVETIVADGLVPPAELFKVNTFVDEFLGTELK